MFSSPRKFTARAILLIIFLTSAATFGILGILHLVPSSTAEIVFLLFAAASLGLALWQAGIIAPVSASLVPKGRISIHTVAQLCGQDVRVFHGFVNCDDIETGFLDPCVVTPIAPEMNGQPEGRAAFSLDPDNYTIYACNGTHVYFHHVTVLSNKTIRFDFF